MPTPNLSQCNLSVLWADDDEAVMNLHYERMRKAGINLITTASVRDTLEAIDSHEFDLIISDLLFPDGSGHAIIDRARSRWKKTNIVVISGYTDKKELCNSDFFVRNNIGVVDKADLPMPGTDNYISILSDVLNGVELNANTPHNDNIRSEQSSISEMTFDEYMSKDKNERLLIVRAARSHFSDILDYEFSRGSIWTLIIGNKVHHSAKSMADIMQWRDIRQVCRKLNRAPFRYTVDFDIDDISWPNFCSDENGKDYPTVVLGKIGSSQDKLPIHFDTGSPISLVDADVIGKIGAFPVEMEDLVSVKIKGHRYPAYEHIAECMLKDEITSRKISLACFAIEQNDWVSGPVARGCEDTDCKVRIESDAYHWKCGYRWGLIGRNLLTENKIKLVLDGESRKTSILIDRSGK